MSNEIIFKKCDSRLYLEHQVESNDNYSIISPKINLEDFNSESVDSHISDSEFEDHFFGDHQDLVTENNIESSEKSVPALPNKLFSGTKKVLNVISWINDKIGKPKITSESVSTEERIEDQEDLKENNSENKESNQDTNMKTDPSMNIVSKNPVSVTQSNHFDRILENSSFEQNIDDESRDVVSNSDVFSSAGKEAKRNRERFAITKSYSIENGYQGQKRNIVDDAKFETKVNEEEKRNWVNLVRRQSQDFSDDVLGDDDVFILESIAEAKKNDEENLRVTLILGLKDNLLSISRIIKIIENHNGDIAFIETRESMGGYGSNNNKTPQIEVIFRIDIKHTNLVNFIKALRRSSSLSAVKLASCKSINHFNCPWFPRHISDLDNCNHLLTKFEPELDMDHPGWKDKTYRERRKMIADVSFNFKQGDPIPYIEYTKEEIATWKSVWEKVFELLPGRACSIFMVRLQKMMKETGASADCIPQMEDVSNFLKRSSGFTLRPAAGLVTARDFLASLAFRVFQCTQYVRHHSSPHYSPEPDCIHELMGHAPMFADPLFAQFSQEIGLASLGASDSEVEKLATLYWFTVEFGLCKEDGKLRAYGAGLLSSYGELLHALSDKPECRPFDCESAAVQEYDDQAYQDIYYVAESFEDAMEKFRRWVHTSLAKPVEMRYNPYTQTIEVIDSVQGMESLVTQMRNELNHLNSAIKNINLSTC